MKIATFHYYALGAVLFWATSYISNVYTLPHISAVIVGAGRCIIAAVILGVVIVAKKTPFPALRDLPWFFLSGSIGLFVYLYMFSQGAVTLTPTTSCIVIATTPVITAILASIFFRERLAWLPWAGIGLSFVGILVLSLWDGVLSINVGIIWTQIAAGLLAGYNVMQRKLARTYPTLSVTGYAYIAAAITVIPFMPEGARQAAAAPATAIGMLVYMGIFPSAVAYLLWVKAMSLSPNTSYVANYMFLTPFFAGIMEFLFFGQAPDMGTLIGGALIFAGLILYSVGGKKKA